MIHRSHILCDVPNRKKLSTTISPETYLYLHRQVKEGEASSVGEAVDRAIQSARRAENRARLSRATAAYFERMSRGAAAEEAQLASDLDHAASEIDFDEL